MTIFKAPEPVINGARVQRKPKTATAVVAQYRIEIDGITAEPGEIILFYEDDVQIVDLKTFEEEYVHVGKPAGPVYRVPDLR